MKKNQWIDGIDRMQMPRASRTPGKRLDCAERTINFDESLYDNFIKTLEQEDFITYPSYQQYWDLKDRIAKMHQKYDEVKIEKENIYIDSGSDACIKSLIQTTCQEGSEIISSSPCFPMYFVYANTFGAKHVPVDYDNNLTFELNSYCELMGEKTRLIILTNPNSPYGDYRDPIEIENLCKEARTRGIVLLIDEAYADFAPKNCIPLLEKYENVLVSRTFSKGWGGAGARVGYLLGNKELINSISKVGLTYPITGPSLKYINFLLDNTREIKNYINSTVTERDRLCEALERSNFDVIRSNTNTIHFHEKETDNSRTVSILESHGVAIKSGQKKTSTAVKIPGDDRTTWIRMSVGPTMLEQQYMKEILSHGREK